MRLNARYRRFNLQTLLALAISLCATCRCQPQSAVAPKSIIDFRYAPPVWQTAICLPDDWQKTLVGKDGALLYDYPGRFAGFGTKITFSAGAETRWLKQELVSPRVPIVRTLKRAGNVEITEEAFAVAPPRPAPKTAAKSGVAVERVGALSGQVDWAAPTKPCDPAFRNVAIGWNSPIQYRFKAASKDRYVVVFGLCEGWHTNAGVRVLDLQVEGRTVQTVDMVAKYGRNVPAVFSFRARDENDDGWVELTVAASTSSKDKNTILNTLWVFPDGEAPVAGQLLLGQPTSTAMARVDCGTDRTSSNPPRHDVMLVTLRNVGSSEARIVPELAVESNSAMTPQTNGMEVLVGPQTAVTSPTAWEMIDREARSLRLKSKAMILAPGQEQKLVFAVRRGGEGETYPRTVARAESARKKAEDYWRKVKLPYDQIVVPDAGVQALLDSSIRNIYQAREIKKGLPAFQVGPTCYRGLWVVDGSFIMEAIAYLGRVDEARNGVKYLLSFQRDDGAFMLINGHWKETGIALWAIWRHAQLTGDKDWLRSVWPKVERGFAFIRKMRTMPAADAPNARLIPDGFSDGGLADRVPEYTNIYWTLAGIRAAIEAARWLGLNDTAADWQREYDDFYSTFRRAAERDMRTDPYGNRYLPIRMTKGEGIPPQKAQWAFLHAVFPGKVFAPDDPLVRGNMAMLRAVECEGLVLDTGWLKNGIWNYFGSFYAHAWLWLGDGGKAAETLYAFGNHASPLLCWREEHMPQGKGTQYVGDMPHNWASAEFIRLVRHLLLLERGDELHLFEGLPAAWIKPGKVIRLHELPTSFGPVSLELAVARDGRSADVKLTPPRRNPPKRIVLHLDRWSGREGVMELPPGQTVRQTVRLGPR